MAQRDWVTLIETLMTICQEEKAFEPMAERVMETFNTFFDLSASRLSVHDQAGNWYHVQVPKNQDFSCCDGMLTEAAPAMLEQRLKRDAQAVCFMTPNLGAFTLMSATTAETLFTSKELALLVQAIDYLWSQLRKPFVSTVEKEARLRSELEETRADFAWFFNHADDLFLIVDAKGHIVQANQAWQNKTGVTAEVYFRDGFITTVIPDDHAQANAAMDALEAQGQMIELTTRHISQSNRILHLRWRVKGSHGLYFATAHDVTDLAMQHTAISAAHVRYDRIARQSRIFAWETTLEGLYTYVSPIVKEILGYTPEDLVGKVYFYDLHPQEGRVAFKRQALLDIQEAKRFSGLLNPIMHQDGHVVFVTTTALPVYDDTGHMIAYQGSDMDVTAKILADAALKKQTEQFELAIEGSNDGIWDWDVLQDKLFLSDRAKAQLGYAPHELTEPTIAFLYGIMHPDDRDKSHEVLNQYFKGKAENFDIETRLTTQKGATRWFRIRGAALRDETGRAVRMAGSQTDITEQKEAVLTMAEQHKTLLAMTLTDPLTHLDNHRALYEKLATLTNHSPQLDHTLAMIDLDNFKHVNDTLGHVVGDQVLVTIADILRRHTKDEHGVGRYGGEEFMIIFPNTPVKAAFKVIDTIRKDVEAAFRDADVPLTISAGLKQYDGEPISEWVDMADRNLYVAKRAGKNTIRY